MTMMTLTTTMMMTLRTMPGMTKQTAWVMTCLRSSGAALSTSGLGSFGGGMDAAGGGKGDGVEEGGGVREREGGSLDVLDARACTCESPTESGCRGVTASHRE
mmetsp:Transcript_35396/g.72859  ORF Transcript_35396/g.72859 Transcript_35396/m.72859 type:complete len:103 (+) Transcript_35396:287-595(+)